MRNTAVFILLFLSCSLYAQPVTLNPGNPHYLQYHNNPLIIISSGEHYGAVLNLDFDFIAYLRTLQQEGMNYTRLFSGFYMETPGQFGIKNNNLAPESLRLSVPWIRSNEGGYKNGGNKFDLDRWNDDYFMRLKSFLAEADKKNIIVEMVLFTSIYNEENWKINPFNPSNNINKITTVDFRKVNIISDTTIFKYQEKMVRKIIRELNSFDNLIYEIQNEPWSDNGVSVAEINAYDQESGKNWVRHVDLASESSLEWQKRIGKIIVEEESDLPNKHLIAQNYCNFKCPVSKVEPEISIMNFHYVYPENVGLNYGFNRVISFDESGFSGSDARTYSRQAWNFILSGGGIFNNLDYSFYPGYENGLGINEAPGGGGVELRAQLKVLKDFMNGLNFIKMKPASNVIIHSPGLITRSLANEGSEYAIYIEGKSKNKITMALPEGRYLASWYNVDTGILINKTVIKSNNLPVSLETPDFQEAIVLKILAE
jgi:hypothetical protein